jgi:hypothetical protein
MTLLTNARASWLLRFLDHPMVYTGFLLSFLSNNPLGLCNLFFNRFNFYNLYRDSQGNHLKYFWAAKKPSESLQRAFKKPMGRPTWVRLVILRPESNHFAKHWHGGHLGTNH